MTRFSFDGGIMEWVVNIKYFSKGAKKFNEDYVGVTTYAWWVLDGSHCGVKLTQNDATWFVTTYSKYLTEFAEKQAYELVKAFSDLDPEIKKYGRVKPLDDASGVYISVS